MHAAYCACMHTHRPKRYTTSAILRLDIAAFNTAMAELILNDATADGSTIADVVIAEHLRVNASTIGRLRAGRTQPSTGFVAACRLAGVDDRRFTTAAAVPTAATSAA